MNSPAVNFQIAEYGVEIGELVTAVDVLRFFEKPYNYPDLAFAWNEECERQAEQQWLDRYADV